jgi:micrococcal nuclease
LKRVPWWVLIVVLFAVGCVGPSVDTDSSADNHTSPCDLRSDDEHYTPAHVKRVVDGDTILVTVNGQEYRVRYIGVNAPESVKPDTTPEPYGLKASDYNKQLVDGRDVCLERDESNEDKFGRWLRYVYLGGALVNEQIVREGYARAVTYKPDVKYQSLLDAAEREARQADRGLWGTP